MKQQTKQKRILTINSFDISSVLYVAIPIAAETWMSRWRFPIWTDEILLTIYSEIFGKEIKTQIKQNT